MSGHNKWSTIKHKKSKADAARSKLFSKLIREITVAAKMGGGDIEANPRLRAAVSNAKANNMPKENIENAIKKGTGELEGVSYEEYTLEGYGPHGVAIMIDCLTDNKNRTLSEIRSIFNKNGGNLAEKGAVSWMFETIGEIIVPKDKIDEDTLTEAALEAGAEDIDTESSDEVYIVKTAVEDLSNVIDYFEKNNIPFDSASMNKVAQTPVKLKGEEAQKVIAFLEKLEDHDDVQKVYTNFDYEE